MRLIDADALTESMKWSCEQNCQKCIYQTFLSSDIHCGLIDEQPTIEAVPVVHAEWKMRGGKLYCTNCGKNALAEKDCDDWYGCAKSDFCPNCGADMRKKV